MAASISFCREAFRLSHDPSLYLMVETTGSKNCRDLNGAIAKSRGLRTIGTREDVLAVIVKNSAACCGRMLELGYPSGGHRDVSAAGYVKSWLNKINAAPLLDVNTANIHRPYTYMGEDRIRRYERAMELAQTLDGIDIDQNSVRFDLCNALARDALIALQRQHNTWMEREIAIPTYYETTPYAVAKPFRNADWQLTDWLQRWRRVDRTNLYVNVENPTSPSIHSDYEVERPR